MVPAKDIVSKYTPIKIHLITATVHCLSEMHQKYFLKSHKSVNYYKYKTEKPRASG